MSEEIDVGMKCIKYMLFVANFMFVMIGFLLISIGTTVRSIYEDFEVFMEQHYFSPAALAVAIGVIIFFVALFGCVGALKESTCLINLFAVCMALVLVLEIAAAIAAYSMRSQIERTIRANMEDTMLDYYTPGNRYGREAWDFTQSRLHCCGVDSRDDWPSVNFLAGSPTTTVRTSETSTPFPIETSTPFPRENQTWTGPASCCSRWSDPLERTCNKNQTYRQGCLDVLTYIVSESALLLGCGALAVAFIQVLGIIFAAMLAKAVRRLKTASIVQREETRQNLYEQLAKNKVDNPTPVLYTPTYSEC